MNRFLSSRGPRLAGVALLALATLALVNALGVQRERQGQLYAAAPAGEWWNSAYAYRQNITICYGTNVTQGPAARLDSQPQYDGCCDVLR